jgi:hypothetical protein
MSRSRRKKQRYFLGFIPQRAMPIVLAALGLVVIGAAVFITLANSAAPGFEPEVRGAPAIEVEEPFFDLGTMKFNVPAKVTYEIRNVGDQPLRIVSAPEVQVLEGC